MTRSDHSQCSHEPFGCGAAVHDSDFVRAVGLCKGCAQRAARVLRVKLGDLGVALFAFNHAKAGRPGASPTLQQVWEVIHQANRTLPAEMRIVQQDKYIHVPEPMRCAPADSCLPEGDRAVA